jgi:ubiquinol-cytochrome c reductase subunit 6
MAFFSDLFESFAPTLAFADNEASTPDPEQAGAPVSTDKIEGAENDSDPAELLSKDQPETSDESSSEEPETPAESASEEPEAPAESEASEAEIPAEASEEEAAPAEEATEEAAEESVEEDGEEEEEEEDEDEDEDDEDEEGTVDPLDALKEECSKQESIKPYVHHYHECIERVTAEMEEEGYEDKHYKEDCVEEFFHLQHHLNDCVAPRLFYKLK